MLSSTWPGLSFWVGFGMGVDFSVIFVDHMVMPYIERVSIVCVITPYHGL